MKKNLLLSMSVISLNLHAQWQDKNTGIDADLRSVSFIDNSTGIISGRFGKVYITNNGGSTWTAQNSGSSNDLNGVFMLDANNAWAVGKSGAIVKYDGSSWSAKSSGETRDIQAVHFINATTGWAVGDWGRLYHTTNGGDSWTNQNNDPMRSNLYNGVCMLSSSLGYAAGSSGRIVKYNGSSWTNESGTGNTDYYAIDFLNANFGFAVGKQNKIMHYNGSSWVEHNSGLTGNYNLTGVKIISENLAYVCGNSGTASGDGLILKYDGSSWSIDYQNTDGTTNVGFYAIDFPSSSTGIAVGYGSILKIKGGTVGGTSAITNSEKTTKMAVYPNPFTENISIRYHALNMEKTSMRITDITGKVVDEMAVLPQNEGENLINYNAAMLNKGIYFIQLISANAIHTEKIIKKE